MLKLSTQSPPRLFGDLPPNSHAPKKTAKAGKVSDDLAFRRKVARRILIDGRQERTAVEHIMKLPAPDESLHLIIDGRFKALDLIPATRRLSSPATIVRLDISTLGFNVSDIARIADGMDQGKVGHVMLLCSHYFARAEKPAYEYLEKEIAGRGGNVAALRTHAKLILMEMSNGCHYVVEGSGNLRSCRCVEQFTMSNDKALLLFHREWMESFINSSAPK